MAQNTIAVIFDFDDTLVPDSTTQLLQSRGINIDEFWGREHKELLGNGYDAPHGYLKLILDRTIEGKEFFGLTNEHLYEFGSTIEIYPGVKTLFRDLKKVAKEVDETITVQFFVISGGLEEIIRGCEPIYKHLTGMWGCRLAAEQGDTKLKYIKNVITFTEKTRYLFEINKGISSEDTKTNPYLVNKNIEEKDRAIPFKNMIYVGDGLTDIPCFSLIQRERGYCFGILHRDKDGNPKRKVMKELLEPKRAMSLHSPKYGVKQDLGGVLRTTVAIIASKINVNSRQALQ